MLDLKELFLTRASTMVIFNKEFMPLNTISDSIKQNITAPVLSEKKGVSISPMLGILSNSSRRSTASRRSCCIPVAKKMRHNKVHSPYFMKLEAVVSIHFSLFVYFSENKWYS